MRETRQCGGFDSFPSCAMILRKRMCFAQHLFIFIYRTFINVANNQIARRTNVTRLHDYGSQVPPLSPSLKTFRPKSICIGTYKVDSHP